MRCKKKCTRLRLSTYLPASSGLGADGRKDAFFYVDQRGKETKGGWGCSTRRCWRSERAGWTSICAGVSKGCTLERNHGIRPVIPTAAAVTIGASRWRAQDSLLGLALRDSSACPRDEYRSETKQRGTEALQRHG